MISTAANQYRLLWHQYYNVLAIIDLADDVVEPLDGEFESFQTYGLASLMFWDWVDIGPLPDPLG